MKTLDATALAEIAKRMGTEPINIIGVSWTRDDNSIVYYADRDIANLATGKIIQLTNIDSVLAVGNKTSSSVSVILSDIDGTIKSIMDNNDIHKVPCIIYQWFGDVGISFKFVLFKGEISSPIVWSEGERTVKFDVISQIEAKEVGFSPEESQLDFVSSDMIGEAWPLGFGKVVHVPVKKVKAATVGHLRDILVVPDAILEYQLEVLTNAYFSEQVIKSYYSSVLSGADALCPPVEELIQQLCELFVEYQDLIEKSVGNEKSVKELLDAIKNHVQLINDPKTNIAFKQQYQAKLKQLRKKFNDLVAPWLVIEQRRNVLIPKIKNAAHKIALKKQAKKKILQAVNNLWKIHEQYAEIDNTLCQQKELVKDSISIANGHNFADDTTEIVINGLRWKGSFDGDVFTFDTPGVPLCEIESVEVDTWHTSSVTCNSGDLNKFYITDGTINLVGKFCLVSSRNNLIDQDQYSMHHIIKITEQDETECTFELCPWKQKESSGSTGMVGSNVTLPTYGGYPFGEIPVNLIGPLNPAQKIKPPWQGLDDRILAWLYPYASKLSKEEFDTLLKLQGLWPFDFDVNTVLTPLPTPRDLFTLIGEDIDHVLEVASVPLKSWFVNRIFPLEESVSTMFWSASYGSVVSPVPHVDEIYVCNILPSTIISVAAYRTDEHGTKRLTQLPVYYYEKNESNTSAIPLTITTLKLKQPLSLYPSGWEDTIYVTYESSVGPNVVDILQYLIETYTDKTCDSTTFTAIKAKFRTVEDEEKYPANFVLLERQDINTLLDQIAWQARCQLTESNGVYYIKYLAEEPESVKNIAKSDIEFGTLQVFSTTTENLVTKFTVNWKENYLPLEFDEKPKQIILRNNVAKYGLHEQTIDCFIYNDESLVTRMATFWMIRMSNTWKMLSFNAFINNIDLEVSDCVMFQPTGYVADDPVKCILENVQYNSEANSIEITANTFVRLGEREQYEFAFPSENTNDYPTQIEIDKGYVGGTGIGITVTGEIT